MAGNSYIHKVPVEIWREILRCAIGPSLSDPERDTLRAYDKLFIDHLRLAGLYIVKERKRHTITLVCKLWKEIVAEMDDKIVIGGMDEFDWPPNKRRNEANYMLYIKPEWNTYAQDSISTSRMRRGRDAGAIPDSPIWPRASLELVIDTESPPTPVMSVANLRIKLGRETSTTFAGRVRVFEWLIPDEATGVEILRTPTFDNLTYLSLSVHSSHFPQALVQPQWTFPTLRALLIYVNSDNPDRRGAFERWRCPNLTMLKYIVAQKHYPIPRGMLTFINNHSPKIEELEIGGNIKSHWKVEENWKHLVALKSYKLHDFEELVQVLPFIRGLWSRGDDASAMRRLRIELGWALGDEPVSILCARVAQYKDLLTKLDFFLSSSWLGISNTARFGRNRKAIDFLAFIENLELNVFDLDGRSFDSPEAQKLLADLVAMAADSAVEQY